MEARVRRLVRVLLSSGSSPSASARSAVVRTAVGQLSELAKRAEEDGFVLEACACGLDDRSWDARIACASAVGVLSKRVEENVERNDGKVHASDASMGGFDPDEAGVVLLVDLDVDEIVDSGRKLLISRGEEFDRRAEGGIEEAKGRLKKALGMHQEAMQDAWNVHELVTDEDLAGNTKDLKSENSDVADDKETIPMKKEMVSDEHLSVRERNKLKRKRKTAHQGTGNTEDKAFVSFYKNLSIPPIEQCSGWRLRSLWNTLRAALSEPRWEARHGASVALREVLAQGVAPPQAKLSQAAVDLVCLLALDRFGDYGGDRAVAPVRESAAQALGAVVRLMDDVKDRECVETMLLKLARRKEWQPRHGGVVGIKYLLAAYGDGSSSQALLRKAVPVLRDALAGDPGPGVQSLGQDPFYEESSTEQDVPLEEGSVIFDDDDVRAAAADALLPAVTFLTHQEIQTLLEVLWDVLGRLDELAVSTGSVISLLGVLYSSFPETVITSQNQQGLLARIPKLWPFFRHDLTLVRWAVVDTLHHLVQCFPREAWKPCKNSDIGSTVIMSEALRLLYQNLFLESEEQVIGITQQVWLDFLETAPIEWIAQVASMHAMDWLTLASTPQGQTVHTSLLFKAAPLSSRQTQSALLKRKQKRCRGSQHHAPVDESHKLGGKPGGCMDAARARVSAALGVLYLKLAGSIPESVQPLLNAIKERLLDHSSSTRQTCALVLQTICGPPVGSETIPASDRSSLCEVLDTLLLQKNPSKPTPLSEAPYTEMLPFYSRMRADATSFLSAASVAGFDAPGIFPEKLDSSSALALASAAPSCNRKGGMTPAARLSAAGSRLKTSAELVVQLESKLHLSTLGILAGARAYVGSLPLKLNPLLQPLMACIRKEQTGAMQRRASAALASLMVRRAEAATNSDSRVADERLFSNLAKLLCADKSKSGNLEICDGNTPTSNVEDAEISIADDDNADDDPLYLAVEASSIGGSISVGRASEFEQKESVNVDSAGQIGAARALSAICVAAGSQLLSLFPVLDSSWNTAFSKDMLKRCDSDIIAAQQVLESVETLHIIGVRLAHTHTSLLTGLLERLEPLFFSARRSLRSATARCCAAVASSNIESLLPLLLRQLSAGLNDSSHPLRRRCAACTALCLSRRVDTVKITGYLILLIVPLLGRMGDADHVVRAASSAAFAQFTPLLPLAASHASSDAPLGLSPEQVSVLRKDTRFVEQLLDNSKVDEYELPIPLIGVELRKYQRDGISWLAFLRRFGLHGILADDMGLGKTLQAASSIASAIVECAQSAPENTKKPSLVVCPPTLVGHWVHEVQKYISSDFLQPVAFERGNSFPQQWSGYELIVTSYETLRSSLSKFAQVHWLYLVLDEGHAIRNPKTKLSEAVKSVVAHHRLVLSGTPLQNDALELWNIFDFLMPGFLGTEKAFRSRFGRAVSAGKIAAGVGRRATSDTIKRATTEAALAAEALHKQISPFVLRRTKDEVLDDLPPKILQDVLCKMSPLQRRLYEDFAKSSMQKETADALETTKVDTGGDAAVGKATGHIFASLQYLRKLCVHPLLILNTSTPEHVAALKAEGLDTSSLYSYKQSPKLVALEELLLECGLSDRSLEADNDEELEDVLGSQASREGHKVLVFAQSRGLLDRIENDLFRAVMPTINYLRLDGSVPPASRTDIVTTFNNDPDVHVLLLTTHVGGLGLNLTSADTVVFMEHDWNPMKDLQAMDRAHRLGQKRTVNVYRLIMEDTLEEKIMGLQKFKVDIANTVVSKESVSLDAIDTTELLDLFKDNAGGAVKKTGDSATQNSQKGLKAILASLEELEDEAKYEEEFALDKYMAKLHEGA